MHREEFFPRLPSSSLRPPPLLPQAPQHTFLTLIGMSVLELFYCSPEKELFIPVWGSHTRMRMQSSMDPLGKSTEVRTHRDPPPPFPVS